MLKTETVFLITVCGVQTAMSTLQPPSQQLAAVKAAPGDWLLESRNSLKFVRQRVTPAKTLCKTFTIAQNVRSGAFY